MRDYRIGQRARAARTFTREDLEAYARLTGDANPIHQDAAAARAAGFAGPPVPAMLLGGMISRLLGVELPGRGTNWMKQQLRFLSAAQVGEEIFATVEIVRLRPDKDLVNLRTVCARANGDVICEGEALVMAREMSGT